MTRGSGPIAIGQKLSRTLRTPAVSVVIDDERERQRP